MKALKKSHSFYDIALQHFRKQYVDVVEICILYITVDNKICGGEFIDSKGIINLCNSVDTFKTAKIID